MADEKVQKLIATVGVPASGKTTWALKYVKDNPGTFRVNKDSIRMMLFSSKYPDNKYLKEWEDLVCIIRDKIIDQALSDGYSVVVDDTNFEEKHMRRIKAIAAYHGVVFEIKDFTDVSKEECLERNKDRPDSVPDEVIHHMHERYVLKDFEHRPRNPFPPSPRQG